MTNTRLHAMTESTSTNDTDELYLVISPFTSGYDRRMSIANLRTSLLAGKKFPVQAGTFNNTVVASTTYYYGGVFGGTMGTAALSRRIYIRRACTLVAIDTIFTYGASPSNHAATLSFRLNNTTDYAVSSSIDFSAGTPLFVSKTDFAVAIADGDYFEMKLALGGMTTVPTALSVSTVCWFL